MMTIAFRFSPHKAYSALHWMVSDHEGIDLHAALKACYFADKEHLNAFQKPIFGASYKAMRFGPVPLEIYEMAKGEALWMAELGTDRMPWRLDGYRLFRSGHASNEDRSVFSESEQECFGESLQRSLTMTFTDRTAATHGRDWQKANLGLMKYEDMLDDSDRKSEIVTYLRETSRFMKM